MGPAYGRFPECSSEQLDHSSPQSRTSINEVVLLHPRSYFRQSTPANTSGCKDNAKVQDYTVLLRLKRAARNQPC